MTKTLILGGLTVGAALVWVAASDAGWLRRGCRPLVCVTSQPVCAPCPPVCGCAPTLRPCPTVGWPVVTSPPTPVPVQTFVSPKGRTYRVIDTLEKGEFVETGRPPSAAAAATAADNFNGTDRKAAKTSIADAPVESFSSVRELLATLPADNTMLALGISRDATSDRVQQEKRNVSVVGYIYAVKSEEDHDFHVILGMSPDDAGSAFLNVEVSGLPQGGVARAQLKAARTAFKNFFAPQGVNFSSSYRKFDPPIPVRVEGSLFFDVDHAAGVVGPQGMRPKTAWEIHPVTAIEFEIDP